MTRSRQPAPPWGRRNPLPHHPTGRARRRWPRAYDGGTPGQGPRNPRYDREFARERRRSAARVRRPAALETLRQSPIRNGLIGLAVAGAAAPLAINRYQNAIRTDPSHERLTDQAAAAGQPDNAALSRAWTAMESERITAESEREQVVQRSIERYADFDLRRALAEKIYDRAVEADVDPEIAFGLIAAESSFRNTSTSRVGAVGLTQLMPRTAAWLEPGTTVRDLRVTDTNLRIGMTYLRQLIDKYQGDVDLALTAYNRGPGTVDRILSRGGDPDNGYAGFVRTGEVGSHRG